MTAPTFAQTPHSFGVQGDHFALDGKPFQIISGEMHYARVPRAMWRERFRMAKAMGLNTITTYVFWNLHEPKPGVYDFSGQNDIAEYIREAQQEGLYIILRPGPYVCAEWEWGGYPAWLLKDHDIKVRTPDPKFMEPAKRWMKRLGQELAPLQIGNGGPIIAVQVENEYGSYGNDHDYMEQVKDSVIASGFTKAMLYTADGPGLIPRGGLPELPAVANFGPGDAVKAFEQVKKIRPQGPFMCGEYWAGWFDHWGEKHQATDGTKQAAEIGWMLSQGYSISIYLFHGGTNFGWMNGANTSRARYQPDVTSYDYDAALDESGRPTPKYALFRDAIAKATGKTPPAVPAVAPAQTIASFSLAESASVWQHLPQPVSSPDLMTMEDLDQAYGYVLYRTKVAADADGDLVLKTLHDYARVYADGKFLGTVDRRLVQDRLHVTVKQGAQLDILVANDGRVNYGPTIPTERVGVLDGVELAGVPVHGWQIYSLPFSAPGKLKFSKKVCTGACVYRGTFTAMQQADTFLDTSGIAKGFVWVNGRPLGRAWSIGPQKALYLPASWINKGRNEVIVLDWDGGGADATAAPMLQGLDHPVLNAAVPPPPLRPVPPAGQAPRPTAPAGQ